MGSLLSTGRAPSGGDSNAGLRLAEKQNKEKVASTDFNRKPSYTPGIREGGSETN